MKYILCLFLLIGCKPAQWPANITVDSQYSEAIQKELEELDGYFKPGLTNSLDKTHFKISVTVFGLEEPTLGMAMPGDQSCGIILNEELFTIYKDRLRTVVWHEIGHCAGLDHSSKSSDIMYYAAGPFDEYSKEAINRFITDVYESLKRSQQ